MMFARKLLCCLLLLSSALAQAQTDKFALVGGTLIDGTGNNPVADSIILVNGDTIEAVGSIGRMAIPQDYRIISTEGLTVMPGLWDPHVHMLYNGHPDFTHWFETYSDQFGSVTIPASARQFLAAGVTSVRDLAVTTDDILAVRDKINSGQMPGPTIYAAGAALVPAGGPPRPHLLPFDDADHAEQLTREIISQGVDYIKIIGAVPAQQEAINRIVATAHQLDTPVTAHGRTDEELRVVLLAGVDEIQHIGTSSPEYPQDILALVRDRVENGPPVYWNPTIGMVLNVDELAADPEWLEDPKNFAGLTPEIEQDIRQALVNAQFNIPSREATDALRRKLQQLNELGVIFTFGSDNGTFGHPASEATWRELETWVFEMGMSPLRAIQWATADSARYVGVYEQVGSVSPGKRADIIAVKGSPLRHFSTLREPVMVFKNGERFK